MEKVVRAVRNRKKSIVVNGNPTFKLITSAQRFLAFEVPQFKMTLKNKPTNHDEKLLSFPAFTCGR